MSELQPPTEGQMNGGGSGAPVSIPADIVLIAPPKRRRRPSVRLDPKSSKTRPLVNLTTTAAAAVGGGVPITGEYQGTIDVGEDKDGAGNDNNHHNMMNNGGNNNNNALDSVAIGSWKDRDSAYPMNWKYLHEPSLYFQTFLPR
ncbi:hypothetical protein L6452_08866 [Arctium lappa]|uniref:Uncharacterized protein n=1 Tax=Arctium lappa TaxID=4217 RepID=A0ACB9DJA7_ARCLA|nr:hypothetical protein L6452_08866 [Arctium lappa]